MVEFALPTQWPNWALAIVAGHGLTDCVLGPRLVCYVIVLLPLPEWSVTCCFGAASLAHFAADVGVHLSVALHLTLVALYAVAKQELAFSLLLAYMTLVHVPVHYAGVLAEENGGIATAAAAAFSAVLYAVSPWRNGQFVLSHRAQRLVISHVVCHLD